MPLQENKGDVKLQKHTLNLYAGDFERLGALYSENGAALAIRRLVRRHLDEVERRAATQLENPEVEVDI